VVVGLDVPLAGACSLLLASRLGRRLVFRRAREWGVSRRAVAGLRERCTILSPPVCEAAESVRRIVWIGGSIVFVVRSLFHCVLGKRKNVRSSSPPSRRLVTTPEQRLAHARSKVEYAARAVSALAA
jgi:hypothetical protein